MTMQAKDKTSRKVIKYGDKLYTATESDGFPNTPIPGYFLKTSNGTFITEMTVLRGEESVKDEKGNVTKIGEATFQVIYYNDEGQRDLCGYQDTIKLKNGKTISFKKPGNVQFDELPNTLMTKDAGDRFLAGESIEVKDIFAALQAKQKGFANFDWEPKLYDLVTCTTIATYFFEIFRAFPILWFFGSNDMGKTKSQKTYVYASHKGLWWDDTTKASAIRFASDTLQATEGIDEYQDIEDWLKSYTRSSYKAGSQSPRVEETKNGLIVKMFSKYHPVSIASKEEIEYGTFTRAIPIKMRKGEPKEDRDPEAFDFEQERDNLYISRLTQADKVYETFQSLKKEDFGMRYRDWEIWRAPLTIAKMVSPEVFNNVKSLAESICLTKKQQQYAEERTVLEAIESLGLPGKAEGTLVPVKRFFAKDLTEKPWELKKQEFTKDKWQDDYEFKKLYGPQTLGYIMKRLLIRSKETAKGVERLISRAEFDRMTEDFGYQKK